MCDPVENNLLGGRPSSLDRVLPRIAVKENVQFRHLGNPTAIEFAIELDRELHSHSLPRQPIRRVPDVVAGGSAGTAAGISARATKPYFATSFETDSCDAGRPDSRAPRGVAKLTFFETTGARAHDKL